MNELIKKLAEECQHPYSEHRIDLEKFTELIIRECAEVADNADATRENGKALVNL